MLRKTLFMRTRTDRRQRKIHVRATNASCLASVFYLTVTQNTQLLSVLITTKENTEGIHELPRLLILTFSSKITLTRPNPIKR